MKGARVVVVVVSLVIFFSNFNQYETNKIYSLL